MGTWGVGPFDNDHAADFAGDLDEAPPEQRTELIARALHAVLAPGNNTISRVADPAVAAAALVAAQLPGGSPADPVYGPDEPLPPMPVELIPLAIRVLDRVTAADSEVKQLWDEVPEPGWHDEIARLRAVLVNDISVE
ncbi:DUF4259 domain-containing protein [Actinomadura sp. 6N118]|uniref:DUF4259 domain-containing protein n=1 Tax=Actinomadura sp. 6N118 TaxID=3375151 RepID=UPI00379C1E8A